MKKIQTVKKAVSFCLRLSLAFPFCYPPPSSIFFGWSGSEYGYCFHSFSSLVKKERNAIIFLISSLSP